MIITFSGTDGSGKTTLCNLLQKALKETGISVKYRHEYSYFVLSFFLNLINKIRPKKYNTIKDNFLSTTENKKAITKIWPYLIYIDHIIFYFYSKMFCKRIMLIQDRWLYDQLVPFEALNVSSGLIRWLYLHSPKPDISLILYVDPNIAYQRKKYDHNFIIKDYEWGLREYKRISKLLGIPMINTDKDKEINLSEILNLILLNKHLKKRIFKKALNNRILYNWINKYEIQDDSLKKLYSIRKCRLLHTIDFLNSRLFKKNIEWILLKTIPSHMNDFLYLPTYDVDIAVKPEKFKMAYLILKKHSYKIESKERGKVNFSLNGLYKISLHETISWDGMEIISTDFLWDNVIGYRSPFLDRKINVLNAEAEFLTTISHIIFEITFIRLVDFVYINSLLDKKLDISKITNIIRSKGWTKGYLDFNKTFYLLKEKMKNNNLIEFPYPLPTFILWRALLRKLLFDLSKRKSFMDLYPFKMYIINFIRFPMWHLAYKLINKAPFGDVINKNETY